MKEPHTAAGFASRGRVYVFDNATDTMKVYDIQDIVNHNDQ